MRNILLVIVIFLFGMYTGTLAVRRLVETSVHAQGTNPFQVAVTGAHTLCAVTTGVTQYCFASDGVWQSLNGAAYTQLTAGAGGGVTSVNGKTGVVVLGATTTIQ
jgi:hypothetical protein